MKSIFKIYDIFFFASSFPYSEYMVMFFFDKIWKQFEERRAIVVISCVTIWMKINSYEVEM